METVKQKLLEVQRRLRAPKNKNNDFGGFKYRNAEGILESVKPILNDVQAIITLTDEIVMIGTRYYVKATAYFEGMETDGEINAVAYAREPEGRKGMDDAQVTGSSSTYARKYALCGLLAIDDSTGDPDTTENSKNRATGERKGEKGETIQPAKENAAEQKIVLNNDTLDDFAARIDFAISMDELTQIMQEAKNINPAYYAALKNKANDKSKQLKTK